MKTVERRIEGLVRTPITVVFSRPTKGWIKKMRLQIIWNSSDEWKWTAKCIIPHNGSHSIEFKECYEHIKDSVRRGFTREELEAIFNELNI